MRHPDAVIKASLEVMFPVLRETAIPAMSNGYEHATTKSANVLYLFKTIEAKNRKCAGYPLAILSKLRMYAVAVAEIDIVQQIDALISPNLEEL